jgi:hypothetical protein
MAINRPATLNIALDERPFLLFFPCRGHDLFNSTAAASVVATWERMILLVFPWTCSTPSIEKLSQFYSWAVYFR